MRPFAIDELASVPEAMRQDVYNAASADGRVPTAADIRRIAAEAEQDLPDSEAEGPASDEDEALEQTREEEESLATEQREMGAKATSEPRWRVRAIQRLGQIERDVKGQAVEARIVELLKEVRTLIGG